MSDIYAVESVMNALKELEERRDQLLKDSRMILEWAMKFEAHSQIPHALTDQVSEFVGKMCRTKN